MDAQRVEALLVDGDEQDVAASPTATLRSADLEVSDRVAVSLIVGIAAVGQHRDAP